MSSYLINACSMRQSPDAVVARKDFASVAAAAAAASVTSHAPPGSDVMYLSDAAYYGSYAAGGRAPVSAVSPGGFGGMHEKLLGVAGNGGGGGGGAASVFQLYGADPGSPLGGYGGGGGALQFKPTPMSSLHNGLRGHAHQQQQHDATTTSTTTTLQLTHRPPPSVAAPPSVQVPPGGLVDEKSPSPPLSSSPGSTPPLPGETEAGPAAGTGAPGSDTSDATVTTGDDATSSQQQQQQQSPNEPLIYPWMRRVHSGHGGKTT